MPRRSSVLDHPDRDAIEAAIRRGRPRKHIAIEYGLPAAVVQRHARRLAVQPLAAPAPALDPVQTFAAAFDMEPTDYQVSVLVDQRPTIFLKSRQCGATQAAAALAISTARAHAGIDVVIVSPSLTQSKEVTQRARTGLYRLDERLVQDSTGLLRLDTGSRIISLPGNQRAVRGYAPSLVIADEASWILDETYAAIRPLLAASHGRLVAQSTPGARVGWFYELWQSDLGPDWLRLEVAAEAVPFIDADFLDRERRELPPDDFAREYAVTFTSGLGGHPPLFAIEDWEGLAVP